MERFVTDERTGLKYELVGDDYLIAGDDKPEENQPIGVWGHQGVPALCRLFLYSQQLCKNIPSIAEAPKTNGKQKNQYTAYNSEAANDNGTWEFNAEPYYCRKQCTCDVVSDP